MSQTSSILIVDDSAMMRAMIKRAILVSGVEIGTTYEASNGQEALALLGSQTIDAVFTDINMPVMTGTELLRRLAADPRWNGLTRVVISTDGSAARREEVAGLDVRRYLVKPFTPEVMRDVLTEVAGPARA